MQCEVVSNLEKGELSDETRHVAAEHQVEVRDEDVPPHLQQVRADGAGRFELTRLCVVLGMPRLHRPDEVHDASLQRRTFETLSSELENTSSRVHLIPK